MASVIRGDDNFDSASSVVYTKLSSGSVSGATAFVVSLTGSYDSYEIIFNNVGWSGTNTQLYHRVSTDGGSTFDSTANYVWDINDAQTQGSIGELDGAAGRGISGSVGVYNAKVSGEMTAIKPSVVRWANADGAGSNFGTFYKLTGVVTDIQFYTSNATNFLNGSYTLYGRSV